MDILDIFKTLAEEPDKVGQRSIAAAKLCINLIFASYLYRVSFGPFQLIDFSDPKQYVEYFLSGRLLLGLLFLWLSQALLFNMGSDLLFAILKWLFGKRIVISQLSPKENAFIRNLLIWRKYIAMQQPLQKVVAGERIDEFYSLVEAYGSRDDDSPLGSLRYSLVRDVWQLCFGFSVVYFFILPFSKTAIFVNFVLLGALFLVPMLFVTIDRLTEVLVESKSELLHAIKFLQFQREIQKKLVDLGASPYTKKEDNAISNDEFVLIAGKEFIVQIYGGILPVDHVTIKSLLNKTKNRQCPILLFTAQPLADSASQLLEASNNDIFIAYFPGEVELIETVWRKIMNRKMGTRIAT